MATLPHVAPLDLISDTWANTVIDAVNGVSSGSGPTASRPASGTPGQSWYDTTLKRQWQWDGSTWVLIAGSFPRFHLTKSAPLQTANGAPTAITWDTELYDTDNMHAAGATPIVTIPAGLGGRWAFDYCLGFDVNATGVRSAWIDTASKRYASCDSPSVAAASISLSTAVELVCTAGQTLQLVAYQTSGGNLNVATNPTNQYLGGRYMGPS